MGASRRGASFEPHRISMQRVRTVFVLSRGWRGAALELAAWSDESCQRAAGEVALIDEAERRRLAQAFAVSVLVTR
jgi:hypothetical protein